MLWLKKLRNIKKNLSLTKKQDFKKWPEAKYKLVYFIAAYKNAEQLINLVETIYRPNNLYYLNIDKKSPIVFYKKIKATFKNYPNIFISRSFVTWGKWDQVGTALSAIQKALATDYGWTHFINLSGQDFPLKSQEEIQAELAKQPQISFLEGEYFPKDHNYAGHLFISFLNNHFTKTLVRVDKVFHELKFYKGSQWMILSRDFCEHIINGELPNKLKPLFKKIYIPDESYFVTLAANFPKKENIIWENKRFIRWTQGWAHPHILTKKDLPEILASQAYFARKFDEKKDKEVLDYLRLRIL